MDYRRRITEIESRYKKVYKAINKYTIYISILLLILCAASGLVFRERSPGIKYKNDTPKPFDKNCVVDGQYEWDEEDLVCKSLEFYEKTGVQLYFINLKYDRKTNKEDAIRASKDIAMDYMSNRSGILYVFSYYGSYYTNTTWHHSFTVVSDDLKINANIMKIINLNCSHYPDTFAKKLIKKFNQTSEPAITLPFSLTLLHIALCSLVFFIWLAVLFVKIILKVHENKVIDAIELMWIASEYGDDERMIS